MKKIHRTILVWFLTIAFFGVAFILTLYAMGWRYDFQKRKLVQVGGIFITSHPPDAKVFVDGKAQKRTNVFTGNLALENIFPKKYKVRLEKENFFPLEREVEVKGREVCPLELWLFPKLSFSEYQGNPKNLEFFQKEVLEPGVVAKAKENSTVYVLDVFGTLKKNGEVLNFEKMKINPKEKVNLKIAGSWVFVQKKDDFYYLREGKWEKVEKAIKGVDGLEDEVLVFTHDEIYLFDPKEKEYEFLYRFGDEIKNALFLNKHHLLVATKDKVFATEKVPNGNVFELLKIQNPEIFYDKKGKTIYVKSKDQILFSRY